MSITSQVGLDLADQQNLFLNYQARQGKLTEAGVAGGTILPQHLEPWHINWFNATQNSIVDPNFWWQQTF